MLLFLPREHSSPYGRSLELSEKDAAPSGKDATYKEAVEMYEVGTQL